MKVIIQLRWFFIVKSNLIVDRLFWVIQSSDKVHTVDALAVRGDERRDSLRKASGRWQCTFDPEISEWGNPPALRRVSYTEYIGVGGERGEVKHLSTLRKRNQLRFPKQRRANGDQPLSRLCFSGAVLERPAIVGDSPVHERAYSMKTSRTGHVKSCLNMGGPSSKAKYS